MSNVFEAVADPTRRQILALLREDGPMSVNELAEPFAMTRQAVTKHLDLLHGAGLIQVRRVGRQRLHELDAGPLEELARWLEPYSAAWDRRLERLKTFLEDDG